MTSQARYAFLDVGQGDCSVMILPEGRAIVVDCPIGKAPLVSRYLDTHDVKVIELVLVTHSDDDHFGGIPPLVKNFPGMIKRLWMLPDRGTVTKLYRLGMRTLLKHVMDERAGTVELFEPLRGTESVIDPIQISVVNPDRPSHMLNLIGDVSRNDTSVVIKVTENGAKILYGADVQGTGWADIVRTEDVTADVFRVPHHGDWYDGGLPLDEVLGHVKPSIGIISAGRNNHGHPEPQTIRALRSAGTRVICTQATSRCHASLTSVRIRAIELLNGVTFDGVHSTDTSTCPCGGTIELFLHGPGNVELLPTTETHDKIIDMFDSALCRSP